MPPSIYNLVSEDTATSADTLSTMMKKEQTVYKSSDYISHSPSSYPVDTEVRMLMVDWCYSVVDASHLDREMVAMTMELVDRFLSKSEPSLSSQFLDETVKFQLLVVTALYISIKVNGRFAMGSDFFAEISRGMYTQDEIEAMESTLLNGLSWNIFAPTSIQMAYQIVSLLKPHVNTVTNSTWQFILEEVSYQTQCSVRDYYFSTQVRRSTVALAAIFNAIDQVDRQDRRAILHAFFIVWTKDFASPDDLLAAKKELRYLMEENEDSETSDLPEECSLSSRPEEYHFDTAEIHEVSSYSTRVCSTFLSM